MRGFGTLKWPIIVSFIGAPTLSLYSLRSHRSRAVSEQRTTARKMARVKERGGVGKKVRKPSFPSPSPSFIFWPSEFLAPKTNGNPSYAASFLVVLRDLGCDVTCQLAEDYEDYYLDSSNWPGYEAASTLQRTWVEIFQSLGDAVSIELSMEDSDSSYFYEAEHKEFEVEVEPSFLDLEPISEAEQSSFCVELMKRLNIQRQQSYFCNITLVAKEGNEFKAHRNVLSAASPFFSKLLQSEMKEKEEDRGRSHSVR